MEQQPRPRTPTRQKAQSMARCACARFPLPMSVDPIPPSRRYCRQEESRARKRCKRAKGGSGSLDLSLWKTEEKAFLDFLRER